MCVLNVWFWGTVMLRFCDFGVVGFLRFWDSGMLGFVFSEFVLFWF